MINNHSFLLKSLPILLILIFQVPIPNYANQNNSPYYKIFHLNNHAGLYYNPLGDVRISNSKYSLLMYHDLNVFDQRYGQLAQFYTESAKMCDEYSIHDISVTSCRNSLQIINSRITVIKDKLETINHMAGNKAFADSKIVKRGLFDGASYISKWLFGAPDAEDSKNYEEAIKSIINGNKNVNLLMKQQISVITNTIQDFNTCINNLKLDENTLNENIKLLSDFSNSTANILSNIYRQHLISEQLHLLSQVSTELDEYCNLFISSISMARRNVLHPQVANNSTKSF